MSEKITVARPYAKAIFLIAKKDNSYKEWGDFLLILKKIVSNLRVVSYLKNPMLGSLEKYNFILNICGDFLDKNAENFVKVISNNDRLLYLGDICDLYEIYKEQEQNILRVSVVSAVALKDDSKKKFFLYLSKKFNKNVSIQFFVEKKLIGGAIIKSKDKVIDGTVKGSILRLTKTLLSA